MVKVSAPGNVFFSGEHSIVYGRPAVVAAIGFRTYADVKPRKDGVVGFSSDGYGEFNASLEDLKSKQWTVKSASADHPAVNDYKKDGQMDVLAPVQDFLARMAENYDELRTGFDLHVTSQIPRESGGMSSSTAFLSSVLGALSYVYDLDLEANRYFDILLPFQVKIHGGAASGAEITSSSLGGYNWVKRDLTKTPPVLDRRNLGEQKLYLVIGNTGVTGLTSVTVPYVRSGFNGDNDSYNSVFDRIGEIVTESEKAIRDCDVSLLGKLMNENHELLARQLGVSHPKLNKLVDAARGAGAYGAKMSGGGMGGIMVALVNEDKQKKVAEAIKSAGGHSYITEVGVEGVRLEK